MKKTIQWKRHLWAWTVLVLGWGGGMLNAAVISEYQASTSILDSHSPVDQGWTQGGNFNVPSSYGTELIGGVTYDYWNIGGSTSSNNTGNYRIAYANSAPFSDPDGWTATGVVRVLSASKTLVRDSYLEVRDGTSVWAIGLFNQTQGGFSDQGIAYINSSGSYSILGSLNVSSDYITLQFHLTPNAETGDTLGIFVNGTQIGPDLARSDVGTASDRWIRFGDNASGIGSDARSETHWNSVAFETGYAVIPEPSSSLLLGLGLFGLLVLRRKGHGQIAVS